MNLSPAQINSLLYINLIRVIISKLVVRNRSHHYRYILQGLKTALVLMPIFGYQYIVNFIPVDLVYDCEGSKVFVNFMQTVLEASQGLLVSIALCFLNKDVSLVFLSLLCLRNMFRCMVAYANR